MAWASLNKIRLLAGANDKSIKKAIFHQLNKVKIIYLINFVVYWHVLQKNNEKKKAYLTILLSKTLKYLKKLNCLIFSSSVFFFFYFQNEK